jgi:lactate permease
MGAAQYLLATSGLWDIAAFGGGLTGLIVSGLLVRIKRNADQGPREKLAMRPLLLALSAYGVLIALTLALLLVPPISKFLGQVVIQVDFPATTTALGYVMPAGTNRPIQIFTHTGTILACTSLLAFLIYKRAGRYSNDVVRRILTSTVRGVMASSLSIVEMVAMALVMQQSGMTEALARSLAGGVGTAYPLIAPWIGALGAFMTGSNTNSNVVFAALQMRTAELLAYRVPVILAGQTAGAALASVVAPAKVVVGASTAGMAGKEGEVMRAVIVYAGLLILFICLLTGAVIWL